MNKYVLTLAALGLIASPVVAKAADEAKAPAPAAATGGEAMAAADTAKPVEHELADGTKVVVEGDVVSVVAADGTKTPAPDGTHTFKDGTTVTVKDGKVAK